MWIFRLTVFLGRFRFSSGLCRRESGVKGEGSKFDGFLVFSGFFGTLSLYRDVGIMCSFFCFFGVFSSSLVRIEFNVYRVSEGVVNFFKF